MQSRIHYLIIYSVFKCFVSSLQGFDHVHVFIVSAHALANLLWIGGCDILSLNIKKRDIIIYKEEFKDAYFIHARSHTI